MKPKSLLLIVGFLSLVFFLSCKKKVVYPPGTVTVKYVASWTAPLAATNSSGANGGVNTITYIDGLGNGIIEPISSGNSWTKTVVFSYKPGDYVHPFLILSIGLQQPGSSFAAIYGNSILEAQATQSSGNTKWQNTNTYNVENQAQYVVNTH